MTPRITVGITLLTLGIAVATLASLPALVENRSVGDVVVVCGLALAVAGIVLMLTAIPVQWGARKQRERERQADIDDLKVKRKRITDQIRSVDLEIGKLRSTLTMGVRLSGITTESDRTAARHDATELRSLEGRRIDLFAELAMNDNELRRKGVEPGA